MKTPPLRTKPKTGPGQVTDFASDSMIELRNVSKTYSTAAGDFTALKKVNMKIEAGEFVGIVGKSGAGKST